MQAIIEGFNTEIIISIKVHKYNTYNTTYRKFKNHNEYQYTTYMYVIESI